MTSARQNGPIRTDPEFGQKLEALMKRHGVTRTEAKRAGAPAARALPREKT
jgi:hypothetical protein